MPPKTLPSVQQSPTTSRPAILWGKHNKAALETFCVKDKTWCTSYKFVGKDDITIEFKIGNKFYGLSSEPEGVGKAKISEQQLHRKYSKLYPLGEYYFAARVRDRSRLYEKTSVVVLDFPTAYAFFGCPAYTKEAVHNYVGELCKNWNADYNTSKKKQDWEERSHRADYYVLSKKIKEVATAGDGRVQGKKLLESKVILAVSNWFFVSDRKDSRDFEPCQKHHCTIGIKLSSSEFESKDAKSDSSPPFDKHGLVLPYATFVALMRDESFVGRYLTQAKKRFEAESKISLANLFETSTALGREGEKAEQEDAEEEEEEDVFANPVREEEREEGEEEEEEEEGELKKKRKKVARLSDSEDEAKIDSKPAKKRRQPAKKARKEPAPVPAEPEPATEEPSHLASTLIGDSVTQDFSGF